MCNDGFSGDGLTCQDVDECSKFTPPGTYTVRAHVCRGCRFTSDLEFAYPLPNRYFSECWVFCLLYTSLECVAVEFDPDDRGKSVIEDMDKGTCYIQRRSSVSVSITKDPSRHVFMLYQDEPMEALMTSVLASDLRVNKKLLRYYSACNSSKVNGVCKNTHGSYVCECGNGYIPSPGNGSCVKAGDIGTYMPAEGNYQACPKNAWTQEGATTLDECYCASGSNMLTTSWSNSTTECAQCGAGLWSDVNSTCDACYPNSWSLPGTVVQSNCLCNPGFYMDVDSQQVNGTSPNMVKHAGRCAGLRGSKASPCVQCPKFSNTSEANASSIWDCTCNPSYVRIVDPGDPTTFVCAPEDKCAADQNPCPGGGTAVCKSSPYEYEYQCQCNPGEGYEDRSLVGGFCLKMWYFNSKVNLDAVVDERPVNMFSVVQLMEILSTQNLKDLVSKSRSKMFGRSQYVVAEFVGTVVIDELAFYEVRMYTCMCVYLYVCVYNHIVYTQVYV